MSCLQKRHVLPTCSLKISFIDLWNILAAFVKKKAEWGIQNVCFIHENLMKSRFQINCEKVFIFSKIWQNHRRVLHWKSIRYGIFIEFFKSITSQSFSVPSSFLWWTLMHYEQYKQASQRHQGPACYVRDPLINLGKKNELARKTQKPSRDGTQMKIKEAT